LAKSGHVDVSEVPLTFSPLDQSHGFRQILSMSARQGLDQGSSRPAEAERAGTREDTQQIQATIAIGKAAAGLVHDLSNLLHSVYAHSARAAATLGDAHPAQDELRQVSLTARASSALVRRLSTIRRLSTPRPWPLDLAELVRDYADVIRCLLGHGIVLRLDLRASANQVACDRSDLEQVLLNLCLNARDAMPRGGTITIMTEDSAEWPSMIRSVGGGSRPGVRLSVSDVGCGIPAEILPRVMEPFFTTKDPERGTGLGLSTVQTIVERLGGSLEIESVEGRGTTVIVCLPGADTAYLDTSGTGGG
jgi:two-component system cell cycle sensor histidine kinase/response regulator CckA